ncbi:MAG TPA: tetratricopeptide repeat protein, partial [Pirellulaceae bacterium]|nr:tetratricopeptide repeat protein [Pirellulaceae bacterium]
ELLGRIGDQRPLVLYIDDLQWGDEDSAAMLADLLEPPDAPVMLLIGTFRSEDKTESPFLRSLEEIRRLRRTAFEARELEIEPLTADQAETLALQLLADAPPETREQTLAAVRESGGNPMFVAELARFAELNASASWDSASSLSSASSLPANESAAAPVRQPATNSIPQHPSQAPMPVAATSRPDATSEASGHRLILDDMLWSRVRRLTDEAQLLLGLVATAGQPIPLAVAAEAAGVPTPPPGLLNKLRSEHLVRTVGVDDHVTIGTYHDRVRESISRKLEPERRRTHHLRLAQVLESRASLSVEAVLRLAADGALDSTSNLASATAARQLQLAYELALHYDAGGDTAKALAYAGITARHAQQKYALDIAERQFRIAERNAVGAPDSVRFDIWVGLGDVLLLRGRYPEAHDRFRQARAIAADDRARAHIEGKLGEVAFKRGDIREALVATETALRLLKQRIRRHTAAFLLPLCREAIVQLLHTWMPDRFVNRLGVAPNDEQREVMRLLGRLSYAYWFTHSKFHVFWAHLRHMNLAECYAPSRELAQAYSNHAPGMSLVGRFERGLRYSQRALDIHKHLGDRQGEGQALHFRGVTLYAASQFEEAIETCRAAIGLLEQLGDYWEMNMARYQLAAALFRLGRLDEAAAEAQRMH